MSITCPLCNLTRAAPEESVLWARCEGCNAMLFRPGAGPEVLIAHESEEISQQIGAVLLSAGFSPVRAAHGRQALQLLERRRVVAAVLDVGLREVMSFQLVEYMRQHAEFGPVRIVLVASVFNSAAYKRRPHSLYGADDYVEQHHIPDLLPQKLGHLLRVTAGKDEADIEERRARIRDGEARTDLTGPERVNALARSIVADVALYNEEELNLYIKTGEFGPLTNALDEGRRLLSEMTNTVDYAGSDPILEAFRSMIADMKGQTR